MTDTHEVTHRGMTKEELDAIHALAVECDPGATLNWDRLKEVLTVECLAECCEPIRAALSPRTRGVILVLRFRRA